MFIDDVYLMLINQINKYETNQSMCMVNVPIPFDQIQPSEGTLTQNPGY